MTIDLTGSVRRGDTVLDIELALAPGLTAVTGANGAGKTTLLRLLAGLEALDTGRLRVGDSCLDEPETHTFVPAHEREVVMLFQEHRLFPHLDALDNVAFAARRRGRSRPEARAEAADHLAAVGMADRATARPESLSLGQRQRVALARTLAAGARVVLLDEPLAAVDEPSRDDLRTLVAGIEAEHVLWVTHDPADAERAARRVSVEDGRVRQTRSS